VRISLVDPRRPKAKYLFKILADHLAVFLAHLDPAHRPDDDVLRVGLHDLSFDDPPAAKQQHAPPRRRRDRRTVRIAAPRSGGYEETEGGNEKQSVPGRHGGRDYRRVFASCQGSAFAWRICSARVS